MKVIGNTMPVTLGHRGNHVLQTVDHLSYVAPDQREGSGISGLRGLGTFRAHHCGL